MKRICIVNHKGGCGKTSTAVSLAHGLSRAGKRVLVVDVDPQGNAGQSFGVKHPKTLYHLLIDQAPPQECITTVRENLDIITSTKTSVVAEQNIFGEMGRERVLERRLNGLNGGYNYVLFDCAPSWRLLASTDSHAHLRAPCPSSGWSWITRSSSFTRSRSI